MDTKKLLQLLKENDVILKLKIRPTQVFSY